MPLFFYVARDSVTGRQIRSSVVAASESAAVAALLQLNLMVSYIQEKAGKRSKAYGGRVPLSDLIIFTRLFGTMVESGMAIVPSLQVLAEQTENKATRDVIKDITTQLEGGDSFSDALRKHPEVFSKMYFSLVIAGEKGGMLTVVMGRLASYLENKMRVRKAIKAAMMYPAVVTLVAFSVSVFLLTKVVSVFSDIFSQLGGDMPTPTKYLITISNLLEHNLLLFLLVVAAIVGGWLYYIRTTPGRAFWDARRIRLPVVGPIAHNICLARFARSMSSLVKSGIPILEVMALVQNTVGNAEMESAIKSAAVEIESGEQISTSLGRHPIFPAMIIGMMSVGEQSGRIDSTLEMVADFLDKDVETALGGLAPLIEPLLILFLGVVVGTIVICMFLPIFKLNDLVTGKH